MNVSEGDIHAACDSLDEAGTKITYDAVRSELGGRGSFSTITKYMKTWSPSGATPVPQMPADISREVEGLAKTIWRIAMRGASASYDAERVALQDENHQLLQAVQDLEKDLEAAVARANESEAERTALQSECQELQGRAHGAETALAEMRGRLSAYEHLATVAAKQSELAAPPKTSSKAQRLTAAYAGLERQEQVEDTAL